MGLETVINRQLDQGKTLDEAIEYYISLYVEIDTLKQSGRFDINTIVAFDLWKKRDWDSEISIDAEGKKTYWYPKSVDDLCRNFKDELDLSERYLYNVIYRMKGKGYLKTKVVTHDRKRYTLITMTKEGLYLVNSVRNYIKELWMTHFGDKKGKSMVTTTGL